MSDTAAKKIDAAFQAYPLRTYPKNHILVFANEDPEVIFYLKKGKVRQYDISYRGDEVVVNIFKPGAFFPMSWALGKMPNKYFLKTETKVTLHAVPPETAEKFLLDNPDVSLDLLKRLYSGLEGLLGRMVQLMSGSAADRLTYELLIEADRFGSKLDDGTYLLTINEGDLASRSGMTRETISREVRKLKEQNLIRIDQSGISLPDLPTLRARNSKHAG